MPVWTERRARYDRVGLARAGNAATWARAQGLSQVDGRTGGTVGPGRLDRCGCAFPTAAGVIGRSLDVTRSRSARAGRHRARRGVLQHLAQRGSPRPMIAAAKVVGVVGDVDWIQFDAQFVPSRSPRSRARSDLSTSQHGYDGTWGRRLVDAFQRHPACTTSTGGELWTMRGSTDSAKLTSRPLNGPGRHSVRRVPAGFRPTRAQAGPSCRSCRRSRSSRPGAPDDDHRHARSGGADDRGGLFRFLRGRGPRS